MGLLLLFSSIWCSWYRRDGRKLPSCSYWSCCVASSYLRHAVAFNWYELFVKQFEWSRLVELRVSQHVHLRLQNCWRASWFILSSEVPTSWGWFVIMSAVRISFLLAVKVKSFKWVPLVKESLQCSLNLFEIDSWYFENFQCWQLTVGNSNAVLACWCFLGHRSLVKIESRSSGSECVQPNKWILGSRDRQQKLIYEHWLAFWNCKLLNLHESAYKFFAKSFSIENRINGNSSQNQSWDLAIMLLCWKYIQALQ